MFFEDFEVGQRFSTGGATLSEAQILDFALQWDPQQIHINKLAAEAGPFGGLIASGFQTLLVSARLWFAERVIIPNGMGSPGIDELRWLKPVRPGDTLRVEVEVREKRPSRSKPDRGYLRMYHEVINQHGEVVMSYIITQIFSRRGTAEERL